jgi:dihydroxy-acid dehydratase
MSVKSPPKPDASDADPRGLKRGLTLYGDQEFSLFHRRAFIQGAGFSGSALERPIIGIADTRSGYNPCHGNVPALVEAVERGVLLAGALPLRFPTISLHESFAAPTSMFLRNLMAMDTEEMIRAQPMDAVVLIGGCDKTVPAQLMGAASAGVPAIQLVTGPMATGSHRGEVVGACSDCRRYWAGFRAGRIDAQEIVEVGERLVPSVGTCSVMGTASTLACLAEALGMTVPGSATAPAQSADRLRIAERTGTAAALLAQSRLSPAQILTPHAFENALHVLLALGGSTNALVHLCALAGRVGLALDLDHVQRLSRETPVLVDLKPSGDHYMEQFHAAGGLARLLEELAPLLHLDALTVTGRSLGAELEAARASGAHNFTQNIVRPRSAPLYPQGGLCVLRGNLAPNGAILKQSAATPALMEHTGRAVVFENLEDLAARLDSPDLDVTATDVLVLRHIGPVGAPGMPEAGGIPIPRKLAQAGVKDMVRLSDGRMSGTAFGTVVLHIAPEAAVGGPLALVQNGDRIRLSVEQQTLELVISETELAARRAAWRPLAPRPEDARGYRNLYVNRVTQADSGCDFDFLQAPRPWQPIC